MAPQSKVKAVRFDPHVAVRRLPVEELELAYAARKGGWKEAPLDDELWDGDLSQFRPREITSDELRRISRAKRVGSLPKGLREPITTVFKVLKKWGVLEDVDLVGAHARHMDNSDDGSTLDTPSSTRLVRRASGSLRSPTPNAAQPIEGDLEDACARYTELCAIAEDLHLVRQSELSADNALHLSKHELAKHKTELRSLRNDIPSLEARLDRNVNPRLLHYLQFDREEKVKRLQAELDQLYAARNEAQSKVEYFANLISQQTAHHEHIKADLQRVIEAERERRLIMESVLAITEPTPKLARLEESVLEYTQMLSSEDALLVSVRTTREEIERCKDDFISAQALLAEAGAICFAPPATAAAPGNAAMWTGPGSPIRSRRSSGKTETMSYSLRKRSDSVEEQGKLQVMRAALTERDEKIEKARNLALDAHERLCRALADVPKAAMDRIPAFYSTLSAANIPDLTSPELFGTKTRREASKEAQAMALQAQLSAKPMAGFGFGKAMHDRLHKKSDAVKQCKEISSSHLDALKSADLAISARTREIREKVLVKLQQELAEEKKRAMKALCERLAAGAPVPVLPPPPAGRQTSVSQVFPKIVPDDASMDSPSVASVNWQPSKSGPAKVTSFAGVDSERDVDEEEEQDADVEDTGVSGDETPRALPLQQRRASGFDSDDENTQGDAFASPVAKPLAAPRRFGDDALPHIAANDDA